MKTQTQTQAKLLASMKGKKVLVVGAHPDDMEWMCGGTVARMVTSGAEAYVAIVTDGSKGTSDPKVTPKKIAAVRKKEQAESNKVLGLKKAFFLNYPDGTLDSPMTIKKKIVEVIRTVRPDIVFTFDPSTRLINHSDHRATGQAAVDAVYPCARDYWSYPELAKKGLKPHKVKDLFLFFTDLPNTYVDITKTIDIKVEATSKHDSQTPEFAELKNALYTLAKKTGRAHGVGFAEEFRHESMPI